MKRSLVILLLLCGCARWGVPTTTLRTPLGSFQFPKDAKIEDLRFSHTGTNGTLTVLEFKHWESGMNPAVITASAEHVKAALEGSAAITREAVKGAIEGFTGVKPDASLAQKLLEGIK
jgi:hypothetical protein